MAEGDLIYVLDCYATSTDPTVGLFSSLARAQAYAEIDRKESGFGNWVADWEGGEAGWWRDAKDLRDGRVNVSYYITCHAVDQPVWNDLVSPPVPVAVHWPT